MKINEAIKHMYRLHNLTKPDLTIVEDAVERVHDRWPDVRIRPEEKDQERLVSQLLEKYENNDWDDTQISFVLAAAHATFDKSRVDRKDLSELRTFLIGQTKTHRSEAFLSGMFNIYLETFLPDASHTRQLAEAISANTNQFGDLEKKLIENLPQVLNPVSGHENLAEYMNDLDSPFSQLMGKGIVYPHGEGFMEHVHVSLANKLQPMLSFQEKIEWYFRWLKPPKREPWIKGAKVGLEALIRPWLNETPDEDLRSFLTDTMISIYGDLRMSSGQVWGSVDKKYQNVLIRWLTKEDLLFFIKMVDQAQKELMWEKRKKLWLELYDEGKIDAAWVAFSNEATHYVQKYLMRKSAQKATNRFGWQSSRSNTSLLLLKIGNKIVVEGCHNYKTHIFRQDDPMAPKLFQEGYDCEAIRIRSPESKPHNGEFAWSNWVRETINRDISFSHMDYPYREIIKPNHLR